VVGATSSECCLAVWQRSSGGAGVVGGNSRKSASNPTSPVVQPRRAVSSPEELAVQDAIDAGFVVDASDGALLDADGHYSTVSAIATAPRIHRQSQRSTPHVHSVFAAADGYGQQHACENLYSQVGLDASGETRIGHVAELYNPVYMIQPVVEPAEQPVDQPVQPVVQPV